MTLTQDGITITFQTLKIIGEIKLKIILIGTKPKTMDGISRITIKADGAIQIKIMQMVGEI